MAPARPFTDSREYVALSLFTGAAGLDIGLERSLGLRPAAYVEFHPAFCETLRRNLDHGRLSGDPSRVLERDLSAINYRQLRTDLGIQRGELDLLVGGPPCQAFSTAGRRRTVQDPRGELLWSFLRAIDEFQPRWFLMENVRGLLSAALHHRPIAERPDKGGAPLRDDELPGSVMKLWLQDLSNIDGYRVDCYEVNAVNYGAPQLRERVLLFGNREGKAAEFPHPTHGQSDGLLPFTTLREALEGLSDPAPALLDFSPRKKRYLERVPPGGNWRALPEELQRESMGRAFNAKGGRSGWWRRLSWDLPSPTVMTMPNHASSSMCHPEDVRVLSLKECARIQGFPDTWEFAGTVQEQYEQVGNAVPVRLGEVAGQTIRDATETSTDVDQFRRIYLESHVRTRRWFKQGEVYLHQDGREVRAA